MKKGGHILAETLFQVLKAVKPGVTELELDQLAEALIKEKGGESGFKQVSGYKHTICAATNDVVVHGIPTKRILKEGDIICIDCGVYFQGFHTDMAETVVVGRKDSVAMEVHQFLKTGQLALDEAIKVATPGNRIGHISKTIQDLVEKSAGYSIVRSLIGHGVGVSLHEDPEIPGYLMRPIEKTSLLKVGMTLAIEVIYNMGKPGVIADEDGWTIRTRDGSLSGVFERSVVITENGPVMLTK